MSRPITILLVEDNPGDVRLTVDALQEGKILCDLAVATDGRQALARLRREGEFATAALPDLILLDLALPRLSGIETLREIRSDPNLRSIPIVIVTGSGTEQDVARSYELEANCYVTKPIDAERMVSIVRMLEELWMEIVKIPAAV